MITLRHDHENGTLVHGTERGDGTAEILKASRFRWFPSIKLWGIAQSRDHLAKRWQIDQAAKALRAAGHEVTVEIDDTPRDVTEVKADRAERLDDRQEALSARAGRAMTEAERRFAAADEIAHRRPFGQPILVGHHSERGARADQKRIESNMDKGCEAYGKAKHYERAAAVVGKADDYRERPEVIIRRIAKNEADLRKCSTQIDARQRAEIERVLGSADRFEEERAARRTFLEHQLEADRKALAEREAHGYRCHSRETIHVGDVIRCGRGGWGSGEVVRVSAKSVSVTTPYSWTDRVSYERITEVICTHAGSATA